MSKRNRTSRASAFQAMRHQHRYEAAEDYTELVADLIASHGEARTCQVAEHLGISHVTALRTIRRLQRDGYLLTSPHKPIHLTPKGARLAKETKARHKLLLDFLLALGIPRAVAEQDVEGIEHHISDVSLERIRKHLQSMRGEDGG